ncbi:GNAT family N-acetyltransferase [Algoriphagus sp. CAU 1675]|uniref:GNAT family N-acetyltransferase n=1 Tax=Algoriphagus sp. CAU 1675 TaxID=3032597 RepID=UPI0023DC482E|nr:GNAT family N-acetyltransferase [Algoriphagus sp. CAU 1675]MDF2157105.1 GNAT family N-acetyltransferase [Algoriphagus sp. CAU 1675]
MDFKQLNIDNLTGLWKLGGEIGGEFVSTDTYDFSMVENSHWPNKLWLKGGLSQQNWKVIHPLLFRNSLTLPIWEIHTEEEENRLLSLGLEKKMEIIGMSAPLAELPPHTAQLRLTQVENPQNASLWSGLFEEAFGYVISPESVFLLRNHADWLIAWEGENPVGTALIYKGQGLETAGIYSLGIIPAHRRKGYAEDIFLQVLDQAKSQGSKYAILQASEMGKGLYLKTGFEEDFTIKIFTVKRP